MKNLLNRKIIIGGLIVFAALIYLLFRPSQSQQPSSNKLSKASRQDVIQRVTIAGVVTPFKKTVVMAPYNGYVKKLFVQIGDKVKQGDPLVSVVQSLQSGEEAFPLRSPLSGTVVQIEKSEGEYVKEGDQKDFILRIDDSSKVYVVANAPEIDRMKVKLGQEAIIKASAIVSRKYSGVIRELSLAAREKENWSRSQVVEFPMKIEITDADDAIKSGMSVVIDLITSKKENVLTLRHEFVRRDEDNYYVTLSSNKRKDITVGIQNEEVFEIVSGLSEGEEVKQIDFSELSLGE